MTETASAPAAASAPQGGSSEQSQQPAQKPVKQAKPAGPGGVTSSENLVTPAIQKKFDEVFKGKEGEADREAQKPQQRRRQQERFVDEGDDGEDNARVKPQSPSSLRSNQPQQEPGQSGTADRSRVSGDGTQTQQPGQEGIASTLSPVLRQAALRAKWEPEVVEQFWDANPELAEKTFQQLHRSQNELSARFAQLGQNGQQQPQRQQPPAARTAPTAAPINPQDPQDLAQLMAEVYGGTEQFTKLNQDWNNAVPTLIQPMVERVIVPMQRMLQEAMSFIGGQERQNIAREASSWMDGVKADFGEVYGIGTSTPTQEQMQAKRGLTMTADQIRNGARAQGIQMSVSEALERAHLMVAADHYQAVERNRLTAQVKRRSASITARPTQRKAPAVSGFGSNGDQKSLDAAKAAYAARAAELGIEI